MLILLLQSLLSFLPLSSFARLIPTAADASLSIQHGDSMDNKDTLMFSVRSLLHCAHGCLRAHLSPYLLVPVPGWLLPFSLPVCL